MIYKEFSPKKLLIESVRNLYLEAFPPDERRDFEEIMDLLTNDDVPFNILTAELEDGTFAGFISYWDFKDFIYGEHFAVPATLRGQRIGERFLNYFINTQNSPIILEVELPEDEMSKRRIGFYERLGFDLQKEISYIQPPYSPEKSSLPMYLMTIGKVSKAEILQAIDIIYKNVYNVK